MLTQEDFVARRRTLRSAKTAFMKAKAHTVDGAQSDAGIKAAERLSRTAHSHLAHFEVYGYPDSWHEWEVAARDADMALRWSRD